MKNQLPTVSVILDERRPKKSGYYPIKLRVTIKGERVYFPLDQDCSTEIWETVLKPKGGGERVKQLRTMKSQCESKAQKIINDLNPFSFKRFEIQYLGKETKVDASVLDIEGLR